MNQILTSAIVLGRTDYNEADRILKVLTPDRGKLTLMAKGVRKSTSKLAGGIELFSVSELSYIPGRGEIGTLVSTRLIKYYDKIVQDIGRTMMGYELIKRLNRVTEDAAGPEYFEMLKMIYEGLNNPALDLRLLSLWFEAQLLKFAGHQPNLLRDTAGSKLAEGERYGFDYDAQGFVLREQGGITSGHIKLLRLLFGASNPLILLKVQGAGQAAGLCEPIIRGLSAQFLLN